MNVERRTLPLAVLGAALFAVGPTLRAQQPGASADVVAQIASATAFSFRAENVPIKQALALFARANQLNIVPDLDVVGDVTVEFDNLPLDLAMRALLDANGYYFVKDGALIRVRNSETRLFHVDYIHTTRAGQGANAVQISSGGGASGSGSGGETQGSSMTVTASSTINFWGDLAEQIRSMLSGSGTVTVNSLAGTVLVTDGHRQIERVADFLDSITDSVLRQIDLEVEIYEVAFSDAQQLGIDWSRISIPGVTRNYGTEFNTGLIVRNTAFGPAPLGNPTTVTQDISERDIFVVIEALKQQGNLKVVSKPRLRTLNNQPAVVRVGQDLPVFIRQVTQSPGDPPIISVNETIQTVTVGTVLSITPQVSADGLITLDVTPAVSRLVRTETSASGDTSAPVIDIRQASSIVRLRDGDTVIMGGLVQDSESATVRKIPLLGDIPLLGRAFTGESKAKERTELVFFLTPRIVRATPAAN